MRESQICIFKTSFWGLNPLSETPLTVNPAFIYIGSLQTSIHRRGGYTDYMEDYNDHEAFYINLNIHDPMIPGAEVQPLGVANIV